MSNGVLINFSGHPLSEEAVENLSCFYEQILQSAPIDFDFSGSVEMQLDHLMKELDFKIDGSKAISIIPPGQSTLSILLVAYLHGVIGHFPEICYLELSDKGTYLPKVNFAIKSNQVRSAGRKFRSKLF